MIGATIRLRSDGTTCCVENEVEVLTNAERRVPTYRRALIAWSKSVYGADYLDDGIVMHVLDLYRSTRDALGPAFFEDTEVQELRDPLVVKRLIGKSWDATTAQLASRPPSSEGQAKLISLLTRLRVVEKKVDGFAVDLGSRSRRRTARAISALSGCENTEQLLQTIPVTVTMLGFDRAMFSRVTGAYWTPKAMHIRAGSGEDEREPMQLLPGEGPFRLPKAAEHVRCAQVTAAKMRDAHGLHDGYSTWRRSHSKNFWMVPVLQGSKIVGLVHADCRDRLPSRIEVGAILALCEQLGRILFSRHVLDHHSARQVRDLALENGPDRELHSAYADVDVPSESDLPLSPRQKEVVRLMAGGLTNGQIGTRLDITEGTVKSHVKRIMRMTGTANRAEVVAVWMNRSSLPHR